MRVLMIGPAPDVPGGVGNWTRLILSNPPEGVTYEMIPTIVGRTSVEAYRGLNARYLVGVATNLLYFMKALKKIVHRTRKESFDLAHINFSINGSAFRKEIVARRLLRVGVPYILHARAPRFDEFYSKLPSVYKKRFTLFFRRSSGLIILCSSSYDFYSSLFGRKEKIFHLIHPTPLPDELPARDYGTTLRLLFLGRMDQRKGPDRVLQAVSLLPADVCAQVEVWMAGDGDVESVRQLAVSLGLSHQVHISDWIDPSTRDQWLRDAHVMILPTRAEGAPMSLLEGIAWGLPVISSPVGGIPDFITDGQEGFLVPPDDIPAISQAIQRFVEDRDLLREMGRRARLRAESLSLDKYRERLKAVYETVLEHPSQALHKVDSETC